MKVIVNNIKTLKEAFEVIVKGADAISINTDKGRGISVEEANDLVFYLPPISSSILITESVTPIKVTEDAKRINVNTIQFNGDILINDIAIIREKLPYMKFIKKIVVEDKSAIKVAENYKKHVDAVLLETDKMSNEKLLICKKIIEDCDYVIFSCNITKDDLAVIKELEPYGIEVNFDECEKLKEFKRALEK